ncbi:MAG: type IV toxin-antitoxin system AbiEi family antitoxin domain-containing protein [Conexibacter sp.]
MDAVLAALADRQHGVVARRELAAAGVTRSMIAERIASAHLVRLHRGVYAVGHRRVRIEGQWLAAVLAVGPGAALSHRSAAALHGIAPSGGRVEVSTPLHSRGIEGIAVYGRRSLAAADRAYVRGVPVTSVARTLVDLAGLLLPDRLAKAVGEAERLRQFDLQALDAAMTRTRGRRGAGQAALRAVLAGFAADGVTRSELEERFLAMLDAHDLPRPLTNASVEAYEVDALWPAERLAVELDGYAFHHTRTAFQRDRTKMNDLLAAGYVVLRFTYADVVGSAADTARRVSRALAAARRPPRSAPRAR